MMHWASTTPALSLGLSIPGLPSNLHWDAPWALVLLAIPVLLMVLRIGRRPAVVLPAATATLRLPKTIRQRLLWLPRALLLLAMAAGIIALARPQLGEGRVLTSTDAVAIQLVVDRSGSMEQPMQLDGRMMSRLDVVKRVVREFLLGNGDDLAGRPADIIGLVQFATYADTVCPLVRDHKALQQLVDAIQIPRGRSEQGTAIGDGLAVGAARLKTAEQDLQSRHSELRPDEDFRIKSKVIVLLTDGMSNAGQYDPIEAAKLAAQWGIKLYAIGLSVSDVETVRHPFGGEQQVHTGARTALEKIAAAGGGKFFVAMDGKSLRDIYTEIDRLEKSSVKTVDYTDYTELFAPVGMASLGLLALQALLAGTWLRRSP